MNLRIKTMEICKSLLDLKSWINSNLSDKEIINFFIEEDCDMETIITVSKKGLNFTVKLGTEVFGTQDADELFDGFADMLEVENIKEIEVFQISLNEVA